MTTLAVKYDRGSPTIAVVNQSGHLGGREVRRVVRAVQKQVDRDFFPLWGWRAKLVVPRGRPRPDAMQLILKGPPDEDDALGYHFVDGVPITYVFTRDEDGNPVDYTRVFSHEVLEMIADPGVNLYAAGFYREGRRRRDAFIAYEVCDPVQEDGYLIDGIEVSNFVVPEWFEPERKRRSMKFDFCGKVQGPFEIAADGYVEAVIGRRIKTVWGKRASKKRRRHRLAVRASASRLRG